MRPSLKRLPTAAADKAREAATGSPTPAGQEPHHNGADGHPSARERATMRRRLRRSTHLRDELVRELGALVVEMKRLDRSNDELMDRKAREIAILDEQIQGLRDALGRRQTVEQVVAAGIAGTCSGCGSLLGTDDRYCSRCGVPAGEQGRNGEGPPPPPPASQLQLETVGARRA
jgi:hypothetical protein